MSQRPLSAVFGWLVFAILVAGPAAFIGADRLMTAADAEAPLRVGVIAHQPPFSYVDERGRRVGYDVEIAQNLCGLMKRECTIVPFEMYELRPALNGRKVDVLVAGLTQTEERRKFYNFTLPYYRSHSIFVAENIALPEISPDTAIGLRIGVIADTSQEEYLRRHYEPAGAEIVRYPDFASLTQSVANDETDVFFSEGLPAYEFMRSKSGANLYAAGVARAEDTNLTESCIVVRRGDRALTMQINTALVRFQSSDEYAGLAVKYFRYIVF